MGAAALAKLSTGVPHACDQRIASTPAELLPRLDAIGGPRSNAQYPAGWAWAGNTPFQWGKRLGSHLGGTRDPLVVSWPGHIRDVGGIRSQYVHVIDVVPTVLAAAGITPPASVNGVVQQPLDGISFLPTLANPNAPEYRTTQYFEMHGNRSIYHDGWIAAQRTALLPWGYTTSADSPVPAWELYDLNHDYSEAKDLAHVYPEKLEELKRLFEVEGARNKVFPIDPRIFGRQHPNPPPPGGRAFYTFYPGAILLYDALAPGTRNRTHTFTAYVDLPTAGTEGVLVAEGGASAGYALYFNNGRPTYTYNYFRREVTTIAAKAPLPRGKSVIELRFVYDGGGVGKGATVALFLNGKRVDEARLPHTVPRAYAFEETFDVGEDTASPVG